MSEAYGARKDTQSEQDEHVNIEGVGAKKVLTMGRTSGNALVDTLIDTDGHLQVDVQSIATGDIQIGAVEIKDATTDNRAVVDSSGNVQVEITNASIAGTAGSPSANVISVQGITGGTTLPVTEASASAIKTAVEKIDDCISGSEAQVDIVASLPTGSNAIGKLAANSGVDIGDVDVASIATGTNTIGDVGIKPRTSGGLTLFRSIDLDETEEDVKQSAGQLFGWYMYNNNAATIYVKFYNATAATVVVGTTTPVLTIPIPTKAAANAFSDIGIAFGTAICAAATTGVADNDTGAPAANDVVVNLFYA